MYKEESVCKVQFRLARKIVPVIWYCGARFKPFSFVDDLAITSKQAQFLMHILKPGFTFLHKKCSVGKIIVPFWKK